MINRHLNKIFYNLSIEDMKNMISTNLTHLRKLYLRTQKISISKKGQNKNMNAIEINNLSKRYKNKTVINNLNIKQGELF